MTSGTNGTKPQFVYVTYIATTQEKLWEALTSAAFTEQYWFGHRIDSDWQVGSPVVFKMPNGQIAVQGEVLVSEPPRLLSYTWTVPDDVTPRESSTRITFELQSSGSVVKLTIIHDNLLAADFVEERNTFRGLNNGWPAILSNLKSYLETGHPLPLVVK